MPKAMNWVRAVFAATLLTVAFPALAQQQTDTPSPTTGEAAPMDNDAALEKFAKTFGEVMKVQQEFVEQFEGIESDEKALEMKQKVREQMVRTVEESGMSVEEYNEIAIKLEQDPKLREKVLGMVEMGP